VEHAFLGSSISTGVYSRPDKNPETKWQRKAESGMTGYWHQVPGFTTKEQKRTAKDQYKLQVDL
jgi:hypothetical protein